MILNHKEAIEFLVDSIEEAGFTRHTILNLHALLANNLLDNPAAVGGLRTIEVGIGGSVYHPLAVPQALGECFDLALAKATAITDPFEQAFFVLAQLPYLQPFEDVNKRVSRLAANIPLIRENLIPLSFIDLPIGIYREALLGVYELNQLALLKEVFLWAYERSAAHYAAVRQVIGEPDPFRLKHREALKEAVNGVVAERLGRSAAFAQITRFARERIEAADQEKFREVTEEEVLSLHEGNYARYKVTLAQFQAWQEAWNPPPFRPL